MKRTFSLALSALLLATLCVGCAPAGSVASALSASNAAAAPSTATSACAPNVCTIPFSDETATWQADLDHDGTQETILFDIGAMREMGQQPLYVLKADGSLLYRSDTDFCSLATCHAGYCSFFLYHGADGDALLYYVYNISTGAGENLLTVYSLHADGTPNIQQNVSVDYCLDMPASGRPLNDVDALVDFTDLVNGYFANATLLVSTAADYLSLTDSTGITVPDSRWECNEFGGRLWAIGTADDPLTYTETMSWTDWFVEGGMVDTSAISYDPAAPLRQRLEAVNAYRDLLYQQYLADGGEAIA